MEQLAALPKLDYLLEVDRVCSRLREVTLGSLRRRGLVVAISGGIDSAVCAALATRALGRERVFGLLLPERDSSSRSLELGRQIVEHLGVDHEVMDITPTLSEIGCYSSLDEVLVRVFPGYGSGWGFKLVISDAMEGRVSLTRAVAVDPSQVRHVVRLSARDYRQVVAATNFKQRVRKTLEYFHADRLGYAVVGTPNRLEYDLGFFVKNGDGSADVKPIAHLYKTQVYEMARFLGLPVNVVEAIPTTDTFSLDQGQDEFFFGLPYPQMDLVLWHFHRGSSADQLAAALGCDLDRAVRLYASVRSKRRAADYLHAGPVLMSEALAVPDASTNK